MTRRAKRGMGVSPMCSTGVSPVASDPRRRRNRSGWILAELVISAGLLALLLGCLTMAQNELGKFNHIQLLRQQCTAAAQADLQQYLATGKEIEPKELARLWPGVKVQLRRSPGQGQWAGLTLLEAVASGQSRSRQVKIELRRYAQLRGATP